MVEEYFLNDNVVVVQLSGSFVYPFRSLFPIFSRPESRNQSSDIELLFQCQRPSHEIGPVFNFLQYSVYFFLGCFRYFSSVMQNPVDCSDGYSCHTGNI